MKKRPNLAISGVGEFWRQNLELLANFPQFELATLIVRQVVIANDAKMRKNMPKTQNDGKSKIHL